MATSRRSSARTSATSRRTGSAAKTPARRTTKAAAKSTRKTGKTAGTPRRAAKTAAAAAPATNADMDFLMNAFKAVPAGTAQVVFRIASAGPLQSARLGVSVFERVPPADFTLLTSQGVDNLPQTPEGATLQFAPRAGADYVITFSGEMHSLSTADAPLMLALAVDAGATVEDFNGPRTVDKRQCTLAGRALLKVPA